MLLERTGVLWAIDGDGGLQILNGEESEATAVDYYGLYWNAKAGPKKMNNKPAPVYTCTHATCDILACYLCVFHMCAHTSVCAYPVFARRYGCVPVPHLCFCPKNELE